MSKTFKCPKCGGSEYDIDIRADLDDQPLRYCKAAHCIFAWSHLNDHLYLKDAEPEIVRCEIKLSHHKDCYIFQLGTDVHTTSAAIACAGFSGFEFSDGSVSLESPWAWKHEKMPLMQGLMSAKGAINYTPVLAKFVRIVRAG